MAGFSLSANVGIKSSQTKNYETDVKKVQVALNKAFAHNTPIVPLEIDGKIGNRSTCKTLDRIEYFQRYKCGMTSPDLVISVNGKTHKKLQELSQLKDTVSQKLSPIPTQPPVSIVWPLQRNYIRRGSVRHTFGMVRSYSNGEPKPHQGWDLHAVPGTPVYSVGSGKVEYVRNHGAYGLQICLSFKFSGTTYYAFYAHLKSVNVRADEYVHIGEHIGHTGVSGNAGRMDREDQHLHFELRTASRTGLGLTGRLSPIKIFKICPLKGAIVQDLHVNTNLFTNQSILGW